VLFRSSIDNEVRIAANDIYKEGTRMEKLVNSLLNLSRIDLGKIQFSIQEIDLIKYIESLLKTLQSEIDLKNLTFETDILFTQSIKNDPIYLDVIFLNILHNSIKYSNKNGKVRLKIDSIPDMDKLIIIISDTGIGIPESQQSQIFGRLFRADNAKNCQPDGNGLGLYVVKKLIELMNGAVWFESKENQGTTFYLELPIAIKSQI
jgi:two-component system phosphate regulon sensor histidine kinase PhoR